MQLLMYMIILIKKLSSSKIRVGVDAIVGLLIFRRSSFTIYIISEHYTQNLYPLRYVTQQSGRSQRS